MICSIGTHCGIVDNDPDSHAEYSPGDKERCCLCNNDDCVAVFFRAPRSIAHNVEMASKETLKEVARRLRDLADRYPANMTYDRYAQGYVQALRDIAYELEHGGDTDAYTRMVNTDTLPAPQR